MRIKNCPICKKEFSSRAKTCGSKECTRKQVELTNLERYGARIPFQSEKVKNKIKETNLKKYGVENQFQRKEVKNKIKETNLKKYGFESARQSPIINNKITNTCLKRYGSKTPLQNEEVKNKIKETNLKKYGVEVPLQSKEIQEKFKSTMISKYGVDNPSKDKLFLEKKKNTSLINHGVDHPLKSKEIRDRIKETNLKKYGVEIPIQNKIVQEKAINTCLFKYNAKYFKQSNIINYKDYNRESILEIFDIKNNYIPYNIRCDIQDYFKIDRTTTRIKLLKEGFDLEINPQYSKEEVNIRKKVKKLFPTEKFIYNDRNTIKDKNNKKFLELDIYIPSLKIAIEYNGSYYHQNGIYIDGISKEEYKYLKCQEIGIKLFHIWDYENVDLKINEIKEYADNFILNTSF